MADLTSGQKIALDHARYLAEEGAPIFVAHPIDSALGFRLPEAWQQTTPDPAVVDEWEPGMALGMVTGTLVDVVDIDPRNGGNRDALAGVMPTSYGRQSTPSGGTHDLVAPLGVGKGQPLPGIDIQAGAQGGKGRGFVFLAPTERPSKVTGEVLPYEWVTAPDVGPLLIQDDNSGEALRSLMSEQATPAYTGPSYDGLAYADLPPGQQQLADQHVAARVDGWRARLADAVDWPESARDDNGRGWEALSRDFAWAMAMLAVSPWTGLDHDDAEALHEQVFPEEFAADDRCARSLSPSLFAKAATRPVEPPPWSAFGPVADEDASSRPGVNVADESAALRWLRSEIGRGRLSGVFRRGESLVHTPRIGEDGYVPPKGQRDSAGPAQVRRIESLELAGRIDHGYAVAKVGARHTTPCVFPQQVAGRAASAPDLLPAVKDLLGVTHTPVVRQDGTILDEPGYDDASGMLHLPDPSLSVPTVADRPTTADVQRANRLLLDMVADFPFVTVHDRANYLGALLTPLLRPLVPPPYKLVAITAPQRGSGKTLLAWIAREVHGGVFKSDMPTSDDELRKYVTATLETTTGPVVQFDNVTGVLKSPVLDGLLTSDQWSDRRLGVGTNVTLPNDRLWVITGNNVHIGGDLERRTMWVTINANMEKPEERSAFTIPLLEPWVREHRGEVLWALLTLIRAWVVAGQPTPRAPTTDSFGQWVATLRGIIKIAKMGDAVGTVGHAESVQGKADPEDEEWAAFLVAARGAFGSQPWTAKELLERTGDHDFMTPAERAVRIDAGDLPGDLAEKFLRVAGVSSVSGVAKSLGKWLGFRDGRWAGGLSVQQAGEKRGVKVWRVVDTSTLAE